MAVPDSAYNSLDITLQACTLKVAKLLSAYASVTYAKSLFYLDKVISQYDSSDNLIGFVGLVKTTGNYISFHSSTRRSNAVIVEENTGAKYVALLDAGLNTLPYIQRIYTDTYLYANRNFNVVVVVDSAYYLPTNLSVQKNSIMASIGDGISGTVAQGVKNATRTATYTVSDQYVGHLIQVKVTARNTEGAKAASLSQRVYPAHALVNCKKIDNPADNVEDYNSDPNVGTFMWVSANMSLSSACSSWQLQAGIEIPERDLPLYGGEGLMGVEGSMTEKQVVSNLQTRTKPENGYYASGSSLGFKLQDGLIVSFFKPVKIIQRGDWYLIIYTSSYISSTSAMGTRTFQVEVGMRWQWRGNIDPQGEPPSTWFKLKNVTVRARNSAGIPGRYGQWTGLYTGDWNVGDVGYGTGGFPILYSRQFKEYVANDVGSFDAIYDSLTPAYSYVDTDWEPAGSGSGGITPIP